jgi:hypothetical protein
MNLARAALCVAATLAATGVAHAQAPPAEADEEALVREGVALRRAGRDDEAAVVLRRAWALRRSPRASGQLALAEQSSGRWTRAEPLLIAALAATDDAWVERNRAVLEGALAVARRHLGTLEVRGCEGAATLAVDRDRVDAAPGGLRVAAGTARVTCEAVGGEAITRVVDVDAGAVVRVIFPTVAAREARGATGGARRVHPLVWAGLAASGAAAIALGTVFAVAEGDVRDYDAACVDAASPDRTRCAAWRVDAQSRLDTYSDAMAVGWAVLGVGVAAAGVGVGLTLVAPRVGAAGVQLRASPQGISLRATF